MILSYRPYAKTEPSTLEVIRARQISIRENAMSTYATDSLGPALLALMAEKDIRKVTVDELAAKAGVGRATFFRNFSSKEEVLTTYLVRRWRSYERECRLKELPLSHPIRAQRYFEFCLSLRAENDLMIAQRCAGAILAAFETIVSDADLGRRGGYEAAFLAYGLYGIFVAWARGGWRETPQEMAALVSRRVLSGLAPGSSEAPQVCVGERPAFDAL